MRRRLTLVALALAFALVALLGLRALSAFGPASGSGGVHRWYEDATAEAIVVTAGSALTVVIALWLIGATTLQLVADAVPAARLRIVADRVAPAALRSVGRRVADVALGATVLLAPVSSAMVGTPAPAAVVDDAPGTATLRPVGPDPVTALPPVAALPPAPEPGPVLEPAGADAVAESVVVVTGDSFWSIAEDLSSAELGRPGSDREVDGLWRRLMASNADRLVVPGNFDLLYPGQVLRVPNGEAVAGPDQLAETL